MVDSVAAIEVNNVAKTYGARRALDSVTLTIHRGDMVALLGPSGAGKSTLLRQISGLERSDSGSGQITVFGRRIQSGGRVSGDVRQLRRGIGFVFQQFNLVGRLSLLFNVLIGCLPQVPLYRRLIGWFTDEEKRAAMQALDFVGMAEYAAQRASTLSGGQQQRAAIARAIMQRAKVILADEPIASLDPESARLVMEGLRRMNREEGATIVVSVHQLEFAANYCDRIIALNEGQIACDCHVDDLNQETLKAIYGAHFEQLEPAADKFAAPTPNAVELEAKASI